MSTSLTFKGIAHPPPKAPRDHPSDLSAGEVLSTQLGGLPIHVEHETASRPVGNCLASWAGTRGELRVMGEITDPQIAQQVKDGTLRGLSLGTDCIQDMEGAVLSRSQKELSVCEEGRRLGTWITDINNRQVHEVATFSNKPYGVSHETFTETKKLADDRGAENATLKAKLELYERRERDQLRSFQPAMEAMIKELHDEAPVDAKSHFASMLDWTRTASERPNIDTQMQLGTVVHACASKLKRVRDDASVSSATADQLAASAKENESLKAENASKERRIDELSISLKEITSNHEKLQMQLEKAGMLKSSEKFDFSKASAREVDAPAGVDVKTENASKGAIGVISDFNPSDALCAFITQHSTQNNARFMPSASNHSILGSNNTDAGLSAAIRPM